MDGVRFPFRRSHKQLWQQLQQRQIDRHADIAGATALFPGSMLFNQILLPVSSPPMNHKATALVPDTLDPVYTYCSNTDRYRASERIGSRKTLVVDAEAPVPSAGIALINEIIHSSQIEQLVLLGRELKAQQLGVDIPIMILEPDWRSASALHAVYRQAQQVVFVDSLRAMDAAYTGCRSTLILTDRYAENPAASWWIYGMQSAPLGAVVDERGQQLNVERAELDDGYCVVENSIAEVKGIVLSQAVDGHQCDAHWLDNINHEAADPVITLPAESGGFSGVLDRKTVWLRKIHKLTRDPYAFFADSNIAVLQKLATMFKPDKKAA